MNNYKGLFYNYNTQKHFYEGGAHFKYKHLVRELEFLKLKKEKEENENLYQSKDKSIDHNEKKLSQNSKYNLLDTDNSYNIYELKNKKHNNSYFEQLLNLERIIHKKNPIKLKDIKSMDIKKEKDNSFNTENNRYIKTNQYIKNKSLDLNLNLKEYNYNYKNEVELTEKNCNPKNYKKIFKMKLLSDSNNNSYKNINDLTNLPKIESSYFNNISREINQYSNLNIANKNTNKKGDFSEPKTKMIFEINNELERKKCDLLFFSFKKELPKINKSLISNIKNNISNNIMTEERKLFNINKEDISKDISEYDNNLKCLNLKKNKIKLLKSIEEKDSLINFKRKLFSKKGKKTYRKKLLKENNNDNE